MKIPTSNPATKTVTLEAEPEPFDIDLSRTAVMVIDMQNAFVSAGGMFDLWGQDISGSQRVVDPVKRINRAARDLGCRVIYTAATFSANLHESGAQDSAYWHRNKTLVTFREHPEWRDKLTVRGSWGAKIIDDLSPEEGDIVVEKQKFSAFFGTNLDIILRSCNIKYIVFVGVATNICVEATVRDAYYLEYYPILISDACANAGPLCTQEATLYNIKYLHGWVTTTENLLLALQ